ncbi:MAG TPA: TetR/AcrR family transcriptional regulator [Bryobacteraceae bacterium]|jgi:AcrR family transcriptional regulator|nr:TetR/AcrR family transcriptional regulator [Bryobacteraceae bacterium]
MKDSGTARAAAIAPSGERTKQERSVQTRADLLRAARKVFARDGFERARLEDIAEEAGKTRGAIYAHFEDKEAVFFAIFEEDAARAQKHLALDLNPATSEEDRFEAMVAHFKSIIKEDDRMLLTLEFKMYALRNPDRGQRLTALKNALCLENPYIDFRKLLPEFAVTSHHGRTQMAGMSALIDGLALNRLLNPEALDDDALDNQVRAGVKGILFSREPA